MGPENIPYKGGILHAYAMEVLSETKARVLLPTVTLQNKGHHPAGSTTKDLYQQDIWSPAPQLLGEAAQAGPLLSAAQTREKTSIIYVWKILEGLAPKVGMENRNPRRGRLCYVQSTRASSKGLQTLIHHSFSHNGVPLFNCAPRHIRDLTGITTDTYKHHLDKWLADIPDQPPTSGYSSSNDFKSLRPSVTPAPHPGHSGLPPWSLRQPIKYEAMLVESDSLFCNAATHQH
ncbi:hypothetical protein GWK47_052684 [Chionoecetes opilio]|uniref:Uncharacterized protein n=1 Tax=Chionoecetes opilio TaxID=41210 RepID=A0A8J4Y154_CHIOP|nr:hypothetical protein GWK47_052684 [Chionoecetes opilio]